MVAEHIKNNCPSCYPNDYNFTQTKYTGEKFETTAADGTITFEYEYACVDCEALLYMEIEDINKNKVDKGEEA